MTVVFQFEHCYNRRNVNRSHTLFNQILGHEGNQSIFQYLKSLNYAEELYTEVFGSFKTICDIVSIEITLTELGFKNFVKVLSLLTDYIKQATNWLKEELSVLTETKTMGELSFKYAYKVPDQMDNVCELATQIIFSDDISKILRSSYSETLIDQIEIDEIREIASKMTYESCKVVLSGKNAIKMIQDQGDFVSLRPQQKDTWFKTAYTVIKKPAQITTDPSVVWEPPHRN